MNKKFSTQELLKSLKTNDFVLHSGLPMGYVPGLPLVCILNGNLCMKVPFLKYQLTGKVDQTLVFPIKYVATVIIPEEKIVSWEDLEFHAGFARVSFAEPAGLFRHDAVKHMSKTEYNKTRTALFTEYDTMIDSLISEDEYSSDHEQLFTKLFNTLLEPSLRPFYHMIDTDFSHHFIEK